MKRRQRETLVFTWVGGVLAVLLVVSLLIGSGLIPIPFLSSFARGDRIAQAGDVPCPTGDGAVVAPERVQIDVLNGTTKTGLAGDVGDALAERGFDVATRANASGSDQESAVTITAGPLGVNSAYTVALAFPESQIILDSRQNAKVTVTLGNGYDTLTDQKEFDAAMEKTLSSRDGCLRVSFD